MLEFLKNLTKNNGNLELVDAIKNNAYLVDVRTRGEFSMGSVKGAINIPLDEIQKHVGTLKKKESIVVFCQSGGRSGMARDFLIKNGIKNVINGGPWVNVNRIKESK
ncbi:MAG: rhodanese-like domain-containing protein [Chitinophagales bacterium]|nr:rhodanese-like domain-containing protein [Chitinophagales bacterium]MCZ2394292.1 rhodanese-like domain-containing protein [Chitinophagales bacterium]